MEIVNNIKSNIKLRESLIELKEYWKDHDDFKDDKSLKELFIQFMNHGDPKVRKNAALLLGYFPDCTQLIIDGYHNESMDYVKEAYLKALQLQNVKDHVNELKAIQKELMDSEDSLAKHIQAQLKILNPLILKNQTHKKKMIRLKHDPIDVILTTLPYYQFVVFEHVLKYKYKPISQGVLVRTDSIYDLQSIRVYKDMLIPLGVSNVEMDANAIIEAFKKSHIEEVLDKLYDEQGAFYYRVVDAMREKKPQLIKQVSQGIFEAFPQRLLNTSENNDIEIVIKEVRKGTVNVYLNLSHLENPRFNYRKNIIATSMHPYVAATLVQLGKPYMKKDGKTLDPFVGTGTLLIEKNMSVPSHFSMGVDIYADGVEMARRNTRLAGQTIYYVHKDTLRFSNAELFDEIITDMPTIAQMQDEEKLRDTYDRFFTRIIRLVKPGGYVFLYTSEISLVRKNLRLHEGYMELEEHYEIPRGKNMFYFFIIKLK